MTAFLMIFRRFPTTFRRFPKISEDSPKLFRRLGERSRTFSENSRKFPKTSEDFRRLLRTFEEDPKMFRWYTNEFKYNRQTWYHRNHRYLYMWRYHLFHTYWDFCIKFCFVEKRFGFYFDQSERRNEFLTREKIVSSNHKPRFKRIVFPRAFSRSSRVALSGSFDKILYFRCTRVVRNLNFQVIKS